MRGAPWLPTAIQPAVYELLPWLLPEPLQAGGANVAGDTRHLGTNGGADKLYRGAVQRSSAGNQQVSEAGLQAAAKEVRNQCWEKCQCLVAFLGAWLEVCMVVRMTFVS